MSRWSLQEQPRSGLGPGCQPQACGQLFRLFEIRLQHLRQLVTLQSDDTLVALAFRRLGGKHQATFTKRAGQLAGRDVCSGGQRHTADHAAIGGLCNQGAQWTVALQLQDQGPLELDRTGQHRNGSHGLTEIVTHRRRVIVSLDQCPPTGAE